MAGETVVVASSEDVTAAAEAQADAAVAIAEAQAGAQVEIAQIDADRAAEVASINAETDAEDIAWLRGELDGLQARCATLEGGIVKPGSATDDTGSRRWRKWRRR